MDMYLASNNQQRLIYHKTPTNPKRDVLDMTQKFIWYWGSSFEAWGGSSILLLLLLPDPLWTRIEIHVRVPFICQIEISSWAPLKPQHSNPNPNPLANQLWFIDFLTLPTPLIIPHRLPAFLESLMPLKNWCSIHARWSKSSLKHSIRFCGIFPSLKLNKILF